MAKREPRTQHLSVGSSVAIESFAPVAEGFATLKTAPRPKVQKGRPQPGQHRLPRGFASTKWLLALEEITSPLDLSPAESLTFSRLRECGHRFTDKRKWDQRHDCESWLCPYCVTQGKAIPYKAMLIRDYLNASTVLACRLSMGRVPAKRIRATITALRAQWQNLVRSKSWLVQKATAVIHLDLPTVANPGWGIHLHVLLVPKPGFDKQALKQAWSKDSKRSYFKKARSVQRYAHYMTKTASLIPGYKISKATRRYEAYSVRADELLVALHALKGQRRVLTNGTGKGTRQCIFVPAGTVKAGDANDHCGRDNENAPNDDRKAGHAKGRDLRLHPKGQGDQARPRKAKPSREKGHSRLPARPHAPNKGQGSGHRSHLHHGKEPPTPDPGDQLGEEPPERVV